MSGVEDLKGKALRGGVARLCGQGLNFSLRLGFMIIMTRLLDPKDFGLVAMVTAVTGIYGIFTNAGLSLATIQRAEISNDSISTLFWVNILVGLVLTLLCAASAPILVSFYREPRLFWITEALALGFLINGAGVQHSALLQRQLRYVTQTVIDAITQIASIATGIGMAFAGMGYWALIGATLVSASVSSGALWIVVAWVPGLPHWNSRVRSMLRFGVVSMLNSLTVYVAYNLEKVLLGRFLGADMLGIYVRAGQLVRFPTDYLNGAIGSVTLATLSRLQGEPDRLRNYFLKSYSLAVSLTLPITIFCAIFANEIILILFGRNWILAAPVLQLLAPTVLIFGMINPFAWLLYAMGLQKRSLLTGLAILPIATCAYVAGLSHGATGVAAAFSIVMSLWLLPHIAWCVHGTMISVRDVLFSVGKPFLAGAAAAIATVSVRSFVNSESTLFTVVLGAAVMSMVYVGLLMFVLGQSSFYLDLFRGLRGATRKQDRAVPVARQAPVFD